MRITQKNMDAVALLSQIISAVAVVISFIYLTIQIKDNTRALESQGHYSALSITLAPITMTVENADLARIVEKGFINPDSLESSEQTRFYDHQFLSLNGWDIYTMQMNLSLFQKVYGLVRMDTIVSSSIRNRD